MTIPFSLEGTKYNMDSFWGRTRYWAEALNPMIVMETERSARRSQLLLDRWKSGEARNVPDEQLWHARRVVEQCIHPTTNEVIFPAFRMSCFLPTNFFIVPFMMAPSTITSIGRTVFIQWFNQSYNAAINYANRSSDKQPTSEIAKAYTAAVIVAVGGSLGATMMLRKVASASVAGMLIRATVPFIAVCTAAIVNLAFMRKNEWMQDGKGIAIYDEDNVMRGYSVNAGRDSLKKCSYTRVVWNMPAMVLPTLMMMFLPRFFSPARMYPRTVESLLQMIGLTIGVPPALALFNVNQYIAPRKLEPRYHEMTRLDGSPVTMLRYYKGL